MTIIMIMIIKKINSMRRITELLCAHRLQLTHNCSGILSSRRHVCSEDAAFSLFLWAYVTDLRRAAKISDKIRLVGFGPSHK